MSTYTPLNNKKEYYLYALIYVVLILLTPRTGMEFDMWRWTEWCIYIYKNGLETIYDSHTDYPPLYLYILNIFGWIKGSEQSIRDSIFQLKYITLLFEFGSIFILFKYVEKSLRPWVFLFIVFNPGFFYNNIIWGQIDGILAFFLLASIVLVLSRKNTLAILVFVLSLNFKVQSVIFLPLLLILFVHNSSDYKGLTHALYVLLAMLSLQLLIILPYLAKIPAEQLFNTMLQSADKYPMISIDAFNWWCWFGGNDYYLSQTKDTGTFISITHKSWGLLLFFVTSILALLPILATSIKEASIKNTERYKHIDKVFLSAGLTAVLFFFFNTQMHERYSHYGLIFLAAYFTVSGNYLPFLFISIAYFLNMESILHALPFANHGIALFNANFIAAIYFLLIIYLYFLIYQKYPIIIQIKETIRSVLKK
jgi:Gpi18-like mannosyltransferase